MKKETTKSLSVKFPLTILEEIDQLCSSNHITRTSWLIKASKMLLKQERIKSTDELIERIYKIEKG